MNAIAFSSDVFTDYTEGDSINFEGEDYVLQNGIFVPVESPDPDEPETPASGEHYAFGTAPAGTASELIDPPTGNEEEDSRTIFHRGFEAGVGFVEFQQKQGMTVRQPANYLEISDPFDAGFEAGIAMGILRSKVQSGEVNQPVDVIPYLTGGIPLPAGETLGLTVNPEVLRGVSSGRINTSLFPPAVTERDEEAQLESLDAEIAAASETESTTPATLDQDDDTTITLAAAVGKADETKVTIPLTHISLRREGDSVVLRFYAANGVPNGNTGVLRVNIPAEQAERFAENLARLGEDDVPNGLRCAIRTARGDERRPSDELIDATGDSTTL